MTPTPDSSATTITVGCKLPNGLLCEMGKVGDDDYRSIVLNGANSAVVHGGYGLTNNVDASFWAAWLKTHKGLPFVRKGLVFALGDAASARDHAIDLSAVKTGFEALDPAAKVKDKDGNILLEVDSSHFAQAKRDVSQARQNRA